MHRLILQPILGICLSVLGLRVLADPEPAVNPCQIIHEACRSALRSSCADCGNQKGIQCFRRVLRGEKMQDLPALEQSVVRSCIERRKRRAQKHPMIALSDHDLAYPRRSDV